jgi:choloylglycine hydrolase
MSPRLVEKRGATPFEKHKDWQIPRTCLPRQRNRVPFAAMKRSHLVPALLALTGLLTANTPAIACTGGALTAKDGSVAVGRTLEFGKPLDSVLAVWPAGSEFTGVTPTGANGITWKSQYGFTGPTVATYHDQLLDGINDQGLAVGLFYFPGFAQYAEATPENTAKGLSPGQITAWILSHCANVAEVKEKIGQVAMLPVVLDVIGIVPDLHIKVQDPTGACIVIEPRGGELKVYDNPVRVLTNSPEFPWHLTNLNNYLNITAGYPAGKKIGDLSLAAFGMGGGAIGLPGDFTPPSRFVRMAFFLQNAEEQASSEQAVSTLFHFLNNFDIPPGAAMPPAGTSEKYPDYTSWTIVADLAKKHYHWKTFGNQNIRVIDLAQALAAAGDKKATVEMGPQSSDSFTPSTLVEVK